MRIQRLLLLLALAVLLSCQRPLTPRTERTRALVDELLCKLDSTDVYAARKEKTIQAIKEKLPESTEDERYALCSRIAMEYSSYVLDSALLYIEKAIQVARETGSDSLLFYAEFRQANMLTVGGWYVEAAEILSSIPRKELDGFLLEDYYNSWTLQYHELYSTTNGATGFEKKYREKYTIYRDSLLAVSDSMSIRYLRNMERKEAREGNYEEARRYNAIRLSTIKNLRSGSYATCLYDRFLIAYYYENKLTGETLDDLLESAIIEVEISNRNIASLLRVEAILNNANEVRAAQKVSDTYYSLLRGFGSRKRLIEGGEQAIKIMDRNHQLLLKRNRELLFLLAFISLLLVALVFALLKINGNRLKISSLNDDLERSGNISKRYVGVLFKLYSSYIKRLDVFRLRIHSSLKKGNVEQALEVTSPSKDITAEERKELFHNFDTVFVDIFPNYIETVNGCLKPEERIVPKKTETLNTELRILALIKLGIEDSTEIAELLHCSVKTIYNLRSSLKARLAIPEETFQKIISEL